MKILIYAGRGASPQSLLHAQRTFTRLFGSSYDVATIDAASLNHDPWEANCICLIMPGGRDLPYVADIKTSTLSKIRSWVYDGGSYVGFCAGAYFASRAVEFEVGDPAMEVKGPRQLSFFGGVARGSVFPGFKYSSEEGACAASIRLDTGELVKAYFNGGCFFDFDSTKDAFDIHAYYCREELCEGRSFSGAELPAVISAKHGKGAVLLSGVHLEYDLDLLEENAKASGLDLAILADLRDRPCDEFLAKCLRHTLGLYISEDQPHLPLSPKWHSFGIIPGTVKAPVPIEYDTPTKLDCFDHSAYRQSVASNFFIGKKVIYADVVTSTQTLLLENPDMVCSLPNGTILVARQQIQGKGRGRNRWISSPGCLQFTMYLHLKDSKITISLVQYLIAISLVTACQQLSSKNIRIAIKWPNDIYFGRHKIGGILVNSDFQDGIRLYMGVGINVADVPFASSISDALKDMQLSPISKEAMLSAFCKVFEELWLKWTEKSEFPFDLYHSLWLHKERPEAWIESEQKRLTIVGIDEEGYLMAESKEGARIKLQPNGNSFDISRNLITKK